MDKLDSIMIDLMNPDYWDKHVLRNGFSRLQLRQEWDNQTNNFIRDEIIKAIRNYLERDVQGSR